jgi:hypothetical protein
VGVESQCSLRFHHLGSSILSACQNQSKDDMLSPLIYLDGIAPCTTRQLLCADTHRDIETRGTSCFNDLLYCCPCCLERWNCTMHIAQTINFSTFFLRRSVIYTDRKGMGNSVIMHVMIWVQANTTLHFPELGMYSVISYKAIALCPFL